MPASDPIKNIPSLNDYYRVVCEDLAWSDRSPLLYFTGAGERFAYSDIHVYAGQEADGKYVLTSSCRFPEELPDRLAVVWYSGGQEKSITPVERTD